MGTGLVTPKPRAEDQARAAALFELSFALSHVDVLTVRLAVFFNVLFSLLILIHCVRCIYAFSQTRKFAGVEVFDLI